MLVNAGEIRNVLDVSDRDLSMAECFMQGAIYGHVKNLDRPFAVRDLVGGDNFDWTGTPLSCLYDKHINNGKTHEDAVTLAGRDLGWIVKKAIA